VSGGTWNFSNQPPAGAVGLMCDASNHTWALFHSDEESTYPLEFIGRERERERFLRAYLEQKNFLIDQK